MTMTPDILRQAGEALYGRNWQSPLARDLDVGDRTVRRWLAANNSPPPDLGDRLVTLLRARGQSVRVALTIVLRAIK